MATTLRQNMFYNNRSESTGSKNTLFTYVTFGGNTSTFNDTDNMNATVTTASLQELRNNESYWTAVYSDRQFEVSTYIGKYLILIIFIVGMLGNGLSFAVMVRRPMRVSTTAFYMATLALADSFVLVVGCLRRWVFEVFEVDLLHETRAACFIVNFLLYWSFDFSVWVLVVMTIERVIMVTNPLKAQIYATKKLAIIAIVSVAIICVGINAHIFFTTTYIEEEKVCTAKQESMIFYTNAWPWIDATVYSFLPFTLLIIFNIVIIVSLTRANARKRNMTTRFVRKRKEEQRSAVSPTKLTIMLLSVTCAFVVLTAPSMVLNILRDKGDSYFDLNQPSEMAKYILIRQASRILMYLNHSVNFFLYCVTGSKFRRELVAMFCCYSSRDRRRELSTKTSMASISTTSTAGAHNPGYARTSEE